MSNHTHIDEQGRFQSDKYPDLGPDKIVLSFHDPYAQHALSVLAYDYDLVDPALARDIRLRLASLHPDNRKAKKSRSR